MWISKPTKSALSTTYDDLLVDTDRINTQPLIKGYMPSLRLYYDSAASSPAYLGTTFVGYPPQAHYYWYSGTAVYKATIAHNLGFIPLCHLSVMSIYSGTPYPSVFIDANNITLFYKEVHGTDNVYNGNPSPNGFNSYVDPKPNYYDFNADLHYTLFRQQVA